MKKTYFLTKYDLFSKRCSENICVTRSVRFTKTIEPRDKTAVRFTWVFNNDVINKNTAVRFTWFQTLGGYYTNESTLKCVRTQM